MDLYNDLMAKLKQLDYSVKMLRKTGTDKAESERNYKVLLRQEVLKMRDEGHAVGIIEKTCHGVPAVAEARFKRDVADAVFTANLESINALKLQIRILEGQLEREWNQAGRQV